MPTKYFQHFPRVDYDIEKNKKPKTVIDIMRRVGIRGDFIKLLPTYYKELVTNEERPDLFSYSRFGNTYYHWVEMMLNRVVDPYHDWIMKYQVLEQTINRKYPDRSLLLLHTHFADTSYGAVDGDTKRFFVDGETIKEYEQNNFGEVTTDLSCSESVANMLAYILGEEILFNNDTYNLFTRFHNEYLTEEKKNLLIDSLKGE